MTLMLRSLLVAVVALALLPFEAQARVPDHAGVWNGAEINWRDAKSGIYEAAKTGRPVIMVFHATWCSACKKYREVFKNPDIVSASRDFVMILVDGDAEKEINGAFSSDGTYVPRTLFIDADGNVSDKLVGSDANYPHTIDNGAPDELLALMRRAHDVFKMPPSEPAAPVADDRT